MLYPLRSIDGTRAVVGGVNNVGSSDSGLAIRKANRSHTLLARAVVAGIERAIDFRAHGAMLKP